jgi:AP-1-like factor
MAQKRKAQNRAAQRAFRERKEKHLKDLETKVSELEKASDAANHENGLLRAQVQRLQTELREYRKRLSLNSAGLNRTSPLTGSFSSLLGNASANNFQFEFPKFGGLPGSHVFDQLAKTNKSSTGLPSVVPGRQNSTGRSISPRSQSNGSIANSPDKNGVDTPANGTLRSGTLGELPNGHSFSRNSVPNVTRSNTESSSGHSRVFQFNSGSSTHSDSPSASSNSAIGQNSSCDTSPEPSHNSPSIPADSLVPDGYVCHGDSEGEITFCEKLNMACGNPRNPVPRAMSQSDISPPAVSLPKTPAADVNGIDFFANQNGGQFDPALFGDYRDSQAAIVGDGDFTGGFFNDAFPLADFGSPFHFGDTPAVQKSNPLEEIERLQDGEDEVVPGEDVTQMLNCHKIWFVTSINIALCEVVRLTLSRDKLSNRSDFKDGTIDIDNLCSELRAKARCSESGVVVDTKDVEAALKRLPEQK